jgi:hypothetical protein
MNYAGVLAVVMVLAFLFPLLVRLGSMLGMPRPDTLTALLVGILLAGAWYGIRKAVHLHRLRLERINRVRQNILEQPENPETYFDQGEHLGNLLIRIGRRREAKAIFEHYSSLEGAMDLEREKLRARLEEGYPQVAGHQGAH